jgi:hypothetical protein
MDWRTSSYSNANGGNCVETASDHGAILVRDTQNRDGGTLAFKAEAWARFTDSVRSNFLAGRARLAMPV